MNNIINNIEKEYDNRDAFPVEVFPCWIVNYLKEGSRCENWPYEAGGMGALSALSAAAGANKRLDFKWGGRACVWLCTIGRPGSGKSHPIPKLLEPITSYNNALISEYSKKLKRYKASSKDDQKQTSKPNRSQILTNDTTIEALSVLLQDCPNGIVIYRDELRGFFEDLNRYSGGGGDVEKILEIFNHQSIIVNRKGDDDVIVVKEPVVNIIGTIQPRVLRKLSQNKSMEDNGMLDRFLFNSITNIPDELSTGNISSEVRETYNTNIGQLLDKRSSNIIYTLTDEAEEAMLEVLNELRKRGNEVLEQYAGLYSKLETYALRLPIILHIANNIQLDKRKIEINTIKDTFKLILYFGAQGMQLRRMLVGKKDRDLLEKRQRDFIDKLPQAFDTAKAKSVAKKLNIPERTAEDWLRPGNVKFKPFIERIQRGKYEKKKAPA